MEVYKLFGVFREGSLWVKVVWSSMCKGFGVEVVELKVSIMRVWKFKGWEQYEIGRVGSRVYRIG